jgi:Tfp pilus assembly protein PilF
MKALLNTLFCLCLLPIANCLFAQYDPSKINKKAVQLYSQAMERTQDGNLVSAAGLLLQCIDIDKNYVEAYLSLGGVYGQLKNYKSSTEY